MKRRHLRLALTLASLLVLGATPAQAKGGPPASPSPLDKSLSPALAAKKLDSFRKKVRSLASAGKRPVVVFDVDDTLLRTLGGRPVPGAPSFVQSLLSDGATVVYQTGRKEGQREKTTQQFAKHGLPLGEHTELWLKAAKDKTSTVDWKKSQKPHIEALGLPVGFFDNERVNSRMFRSEFPKSTVFRLNTKAYYPDPGGSGTIWVIDSFDPAAK